MGWVFLFLKDPPTPKTVASKKDTPTWMFNQRQVSRSYDHGENEGQDLLAN